VTAPAEIPSFVPRASWSDKLAHVLAVWFGCGHVPYAPGTAGTLGAIPLYLLLRPHGIGAVAAAAVVVIAIGVWAATRVERSTGLHDPQIVCIDEVAGVLCTYLGATPDLTGLIAGFVVFRALDVLKPWPAVRASRLQGGWGVVLDDVIAGLWGALLLKLLG
jgi:phosphatidylglycerophosphatase A